MRRYCTSNSNKKRAFKGVEKTIWVACWDTPASSKPALTTRLTRSRWTLSVSPTSSKVGQTQHHRVRGVAGGVSRGKYVQLTKMMLVTI